MVFWGSGLALFSSLLGLGNVVRVAVIAHSFLMKSINNG